MSAQTTTYPFKSLIYQSSRLYNWLTRFLYDQKKKYMTIAKLIGNTSKRVLDIPCGTGYLARYLHPSTTYEGWDLNYKFLKRIKKDWNKGRIRLKKVILKNNNVFNFNDYGEKDVIVLCDILHHIYPKHIELVENAKKHAKTVIICEPKVIRPQDNMNGHDLLARCAIKIIKIFPARLVKIMDFTLGDNDGINSYSNRNCWKYNEKSLIELYNKMGFSKIYSLMDDYIGIWTEKNKNVTCI
jgi:SAM-dependent methyltransferase